ncbi:MAG: ABC transporter substrate-binding protein [Spirochaetes bacterium]|nr:ABC transporter substrate-binding protein [Spirochaetota bacterium]
MKNRIVLGLLILALALASGGTAFAQGSGILTFGLSGNPDTLDPHKTSGTLTFQVIKSFYDTLVEPDPAGKIIPALAESWTVSADGLTWTFKLRPDVVFHNGQALTSKDVKATFDRILAKETASPKRGDFTQIKSIETPNALTVSFTLNSAYAPFLANLASGWGAILPSGLIEKGYNFASEPVGTGPFKFSKWIRDNKISMVKNDSYWMKGLPKLAGVDFNVVPERTVQVQGLLSGAIGVVDIVDPEDLPVLQANPKVKIAKALTAQILVMAINCSKPPLNDLRVRQAISYAIDKQTVLDVAYGGGKVGSTFIDTGNAYYTDFTSFYPYNPEKAKQLIKEAGVGDHEFTIHAPQNYPLHVKAAELYQQMLEKVGMNVKIQLVDWSAWISGVYTDRNYELTVIGHTGKLDPDGTLAGYGTDARYVKWINQPVADTLKKAATVSDFTARKKLYTEALEIMAREVPFMYLGTSYRYVGTRSNVIDFRMTPSLDSFDFRWTELK